VLFGTLLPKARVRAPRIVQDVLVAILSIATAVSVASRAGVNLSGLIATSAVLTAVLGLSLQDVISNVAGGLALQVDTSLEVGDWIKVNDLTGRVTEVRWRFTAVETRNWETILIPNIVLMRNQVTIVGRRTGQPTLARRWVSFNVDWHHQPSDVIEVVTNAIRGAKIPRVAADPPPDVILMDLGDSSGKYAVRYWLTDLAADDPTDSDVRTRIFFALQRADMRLALPSRNVFVTNEDDHHREVKTDQQLARRRHVLECIELFKPLAPDELLELAVSLKYAPFTGGEVMTRQGAEAHWLYIIEDGTASVRISDDATEREVAKLGPFSFFGEMSLLTGRPRAATVVAVTDVECFRLDKNAFQKVIEKRPEMARDFAEALAKRSVELEAAREGLDAETANARQASSENDLFTQIRSFFRLR
jgi:small-conductance mechanosensitive channel/CRP-like cAMP-binding protein